MGISSVPDVASLSATDRASIDAALAYGAAQPARTYLTKAQTVISGGGVLAVDTGYNVKWSDRFIVMGAGRGATTATNGYFDITTPPAGTVIPRVGGGVGASVTATAAGIGLATWDCLYYILPLGSNNTSVAANFRIVNYTADFTVPDEWVFLCVLNGDSSAGGGGSTVQWCTGVSMTPWIALAMTNGWVNYGAGWGPATFCKRNGDVRLAGLIRGGASTGPFATLPVGFRPGQSKLNIIGVDTYGTVVPRVDVFATGVVSFVAGSSGFVSLDQITFPAEG